MDSELFFDGDKFISSRRAAKIGAYTNDYIGQMCRDGKLTCKMVGRTWYVSEKALLVHKNANPNGKFWRKGRMEQREFLKKRVRTSSTPTISVAPVLEKETKDNRGTKASEEVLQMGGEIKYENEAVVVLPNLTKSEPLTQETSEITRTKLKRTLSFLSPTFVKTLFLIGAISVSVLLSSAVLKVNPGSQVVYEQMAKSISSPLNRAKGEIFLIPQQALSSSATENFNNVALSFYRSVKDFIRGARIRILVLLSGKDVAVETNVPAQTGTSQGVVVVSKDELEDAETTISRIKNSFSDEVSVAPDDDGSSGVIKPIFKSQYEDEYLYVLVPIKN